MNRSLICIRLDDDYGPWIRPAGAAGLSVMGLSSSNGGSPTVTSLGPRSMRSITFTSACHSSAWRSRHTAMYTVVLASVRHGSGRLDGVEYFGVRARIH